MISNNQLCTGLILCRRRSCRYRKRDCMHRGENGTMAARLFKLLTTVRSRSLQRHTYTQNCQPIPVAILHQGTLPSHICPLRPAASCVPLSPLLSKSIARSTPSVVKSSSSLLAPPPSRVPHLGPEAIAVPDPSDQKPLLYQIPSRCRSSPRGLFLKNFVTGNVGRLQMITTSQLNN